jgi:hypothetical protein
MIEYFSTNWEDKKVARTTGCGCCSTELLVEDERDEIITELKRNLRMVEEGCRILGISLNELKEMQNYTK